MNYIHRLLTFLVAVGAWAQPQTVVNTTDGPVKGASVNGTLIWRSIPFAAPPVGQLRFRAPAPVTPWSATRDVTAFPPACPQIKLDGQLFYGSEDCLYLTVYVPEAAAAAAAVAGQSLPVMFWIVGGAFIVGDEEELGIYDGANLAKDKGVIIVAANYRVGPFGFYALDELAAEDPGNSTGNAAMQDQVAALTWTRDNIASFGGDPARVTVWGESAGGFSVAWHLTSPSSARLFHAAIMESGSTQAPQFFQPKADAVAFNELYSQALGCSASGPALLACLRSHSTEHIMESVADWLNPDWPFTTTSATGAADVEGARAALKQRFAAAAAMHAHNDQKTMSAAAAALNGPKAAGRLPALAPLMPWGPAIDGRPTGTLDMPLERIKAGTFNKVPLLLGTNKDEGSIFVPTFLLIAKGVHWPIQDGDLPLVIAQAFNMYNATLVAQLTAQSIMPAYPSSSYKDNYWRASAMITHAFFACVARRTARAVAAAGVPAYLYQFTYNATGQIMWDLFGDAHSSELEYVFRNQWLNDFSKDDWAISDAFSGYWTNFASSGSPNTGSSSVPLPWPQYTAANDANVVIALPFGTASGLDGAICDVWDAFQTALDAGGVL